MKIADLEYPKLVDLLKPYEPKGRTESATFLNWFLEHIYRLDDVAADDAICDKENDKGIDGIYVDDVNEEIHLLQAKLRKRVGATLGDSDLKTFAGSVTQFMTPENIDLILSGNANDELKEIIKRTDLRDKVKNGYAVLGVFITNQDRDTNCDEYLKINRDLRVYDRNAIADAYVDIEEDEGITGSFTFTLDQTPLNYPVSSIATVYIFPALGSELVKLGGISDGSLFSRNVRLGLGNTKVNKDIADSIRNPKEHIKFPLYHNGITLICDVAKLDAKANKIEVTNYSVVNGAQSLSALFAHRDAITKDLSINLKVIELKGNRELASVITLNSNNQNAIKPRDLRSNHVIQKRLKEEFKKFPDYDFEIKRGETAKGKEVITNEDAGRMLLAFDGLEPWSCHQIYKVFDELYSDVFGRKEVNATRIVLLHETMKVIGDKINVVENKPFGHYALTKYFLLSLISTIMRADTDGIKVIAKPETVLGNAKSRGAYLKALAELLGGIIIDLNYEVRAISDKEPFDYKESLKSPQKVKDLTAAIMRSFEKDVQRRKAEAFGALYQKYLKAA